MPKRVSSARVCITLCQAIIWAGATMFPRASCTMCLAKTLSAVEYGAPHGLWPSRMVPSSVINVKLWNINPAFSATVICPNRSETRASSGWRGSSYTSSRPLPFKSRYVTPSIVSRGFGIVVPSCYQRIRTDRAPRKDVLGRYSIVWSGATWAVGNACTNWRKTICASSRASGAPMQ